MLYSAECYRCKKTYTFTNKHNLIRHLDADVCLNPNYTPRQRLAHHRMYCKICEKQFNDKNAYAMHAKYHNPNFPVKCEFCKYGFISQAKFGGIAHTTDCKNKLSRFCPLCEKTKFSTLRAFTKHQKSCAKDSWKFQDIDE